MVRHIVMWNYADGFTDEQNANNAKEMKQKLENLIAHIDGIKLLSVTVNPLPSGNRDIILDSIFESEEALKSYIDHPEHVRVGSFVRSVTKDRASIDYVVEEK